MAHKHSVYDSDKHFSINNITREIKNESSTKKGLIQNDHNSERFTFELQRNIDGHDMSLCNKIEVYYINVSADNNEQNANVYPVDDMQISPDSENVIIFSWLISANATQLSGSLSFMIRFSCVDDDGQIEYAWHTDAYVGIVVKESMSAEQVIDVYPDVLEKWKNDVLYDADGVITEIEKAKSKMLSEIKLAAGIVQNKGDSETAVMSQKTTTDNIEAILSAFETEGGYNLLDPDNSESGFYKNNDGALVKEESGLGIRTITPISVEPGTALYITSNSTENSDHYIGVLQLDESGSVVHENFFPVSHMLSAVRKVNILSTVTAVHIFSYISVLGIEHTYPFDAICISKVEITEYEKYGAVKKTLRLKDDYSPALLAEFQKEASEGLEQVENDLAEFQKEASEGLERVGNDLADLGLVLENGKVCQKYMEYKEV